MMKGDEFQLLNSNFALDQYNETMVQILFLAPRVVHQKMLNFFVIKIVFLPPDKTNVNKMVLSRYKYYYVC